MTQKTCTELAQDRESLGISYVKKPPEALLVKEEPLGYEGGTLNFDSFDWKNFESARNNFDNIGHMLVIWQNGKTVNVVNNENGSINMQEVHEESKPLNPDDADDQCAPMMNTGEAHEEYDENLVRPVYEPSSYYVTSDGKVCSSSSSAHGVTAEGLTDPKVAAAIDDCEVSSRRSLCGEFEMSMNVQEVGPYASRGGAWLGAGGGAGLLLDGHGHGTGGSDDVEMMQICGNPANRGCSAAAESGGGKGLGQHTLGNSQNITRGNMQGTRERGTKSKSTILQKGHRSSEEVADVEMKDGNALNNDTEEAKGKFQMENSTCIFTAIAESATGSASSSCTASARSNCTSNSNWSGSKGRSNHKQGPNHQGNHGSWQRPNPYNRSQSAQSSKTNAGPVLSNTGLPSAAATIGGSGFNNTSGNQFNNSARGPFDVFNPNGAVSAPTACKMHHGIGTQDGSQRDTEFRNQSSQRTQPNRNCGTDTKQQRPAALISHSSDVSKPGFCKARINEFNGYRMRARLPPGHTMILTFPEQQNSSSDGECSTPTAGDRGKSKTQSNEKNEQKKKCNISDVPRMLFRIQFHSVGGNKTDDAECASPAEPKHGKNGTTSVDGREFIHSQMAVS